MQFKSKKIFLTAVLIGVVLAGFIFIFANAAINSKYVKEHILKNFNLEYEAKDLNIRLRLNLDLNISAKNLSIYDKNKTNCFVEMQKPEITIKIPSLIFKKINIKKFNSDEFVMNIKRDKTGKIDLLNLINYDFKNEKDYTLTRLYSDIKVFELVFDDDYFIKNKTKLKLSNSDIKISKKKKIFIIKEQGKIESVFENRPSNISDVNFYINKNLKNKNAELDVNLDNINLYLFSDLVRKYISKDILSLGGYANLNIKTKDSHKLNLKITNPYLKLSSEKVISPYKTVNLDADFLFEKNNIKLNNLRLLSDELDIASYGEIRNYSSSKPEFEINSEIKNTQINRFLYFIPDNAIFYRPEGIPTLKKSNFYGILNGKTQLKLFPLDIAGSIKIEDIHIPDYPKPYRQNDATILFMKDKMRIFTRVYTPDNEYVIVDGISNLDDSLYGKYSIKSTKKIDLKFAKMYLVPIQQIIGFNIGPVPIMNISGWGNIDIKTQGTINDAQIFGQFNAYQAKASINGLDAELSDGECKLIFDNRNLIFKEIKGILDGAKFTLTGIGNTKGEVDLEVKVDNAYLSKILKTFDNSVLTQVYKPAIKNIAAVSGLINCKLNLKGAIKDYEKEEFLNDLNLSGGFELKNNKIILNNALSIKNVLGTVNFSDKDSQSGMIEFMLGNSKLNTTFNIKDNLKNIISGKDFDINIELNSNKLAFSDIIRELKNIKFLNNKISFNFLDDFSDIDFYSKINLKTNSKLSINDIDLNKFQTNGYIVGLNSQKNKNITFKQGLIRIENNNIVFDNFIVQFFEGIIQARGTSANNLKISLNNINLEKFDKLIPKIKLKNAIIKSGEITLHKDNLKFNSINIDYNKMPVLINISTAINSKNDNINAVFSTILNETTTDYIINPYLSYPIKVKGEIPLKGRFIGNAQNYLIDFTTKIPKESDISFSGANIGDTSQDREMSGKLSVSGNILTLNNLRLIKYIKNQNNKLNPINVITLNGKAIQKNDSIYYDNFKIVTTNPINVRILNLVFKKSVLKKGNFECNLNLNGNIQTPELLGKIDLQDLDIPLYDTQINNIKINISPSYIDANITAKNKQSDMKVDIRAVNNLKPPYVINKISVDSNKLNIHDILESIPSQNIKTDITKKQDFQFKPNDIIVKEGNFKFADVVFDKINAKNLHGTFSYKDSVFDLKNILFNIAQGKVEARGDYSLKSTKLNLKANVADCDANILAKDFLNLSGQIYGKMAGTIGLTAKNLNTPEGIKNIESEVAFSIDNGKMPKLGSLEYLLRAGNVLRNGILGLSLNNLIQVLTPYRTGEFEKISGSMQISKGEVKNLEIISKGKNLSMYLFGKYSILENFADIQLYGRLSQNVSNALGAVGNVSIKQFINSFVRKKDTERTEQLQEYLDKIPLVEGSIQGGYFSAKVFGDINKENYVKKFNWE